MSRLSRVLRSRREEFLWVYGELFPYLPGWVECAARCAGKPIIYDMDDAFFNQYDSHPNLLVRRLLGRKLVPLLRGASLAICGNSYLRDYASRYCRRTEIVPTVVDTAIYMPSGRRDNTEPVTVGWIGSPSTWTYVRPLVPLLQSIAEERDLRICVVGAGPHNTGPSRLDFRDWSETEEIALIQGMDIGIMPLPDQPWARGKCGYKLIQYMACGRPVVASPVGVNAEIVEHGVNGFLATTEAEWAEAIRELAADPHLRARMGAAGRRKVEQSYSLEVHGPRLARLVREVVENAGTDVSRSGSICAA
jgi:glycosyltransferase involved in cell wall biosynthesis